MNSGAKSLSDFCPAMILACARKRTPGRSRWKVGTEELALALQQDFGDLAISEGFVSKALATLSDAGLCRIDRTGDAYSYEVNADLQGLVQRAYSEREKFSQATVLDDISALYERLRSFRLISDYPAIENYYYYGDGWLQRRVRELISPRNEKNKRKPQRKKLPSVRSDKPKAIPVGSYSDEVIISAVDPDRILEILQDIEVKMASMTISNSEMAAAHSYILAIRALANSPDPDFNLIWIIVERAAAVAGIASLFLSLVALFK